MQQDPIEKSAMEQEAANARQPGAKDGPAEAEAAREGPAETRETASHEADDAVEAAENGGELERLQAENAALRDRLMRALAEVENIRRRGEQERRNQARYAVAPLAQALFPVADNLARALEAAPDVPEDGANGKLKGFIDGVAMTGKQLAEAFDKAGINGIKCFLHADDSACRQNFECDFAAGQGSDVIHEIAKHLHFSGLCANHRLNTNMDFFGLRHDRYSEHGQTSNG